MKRFISIFLFLTFSTQMIFHDVAMAQVFVPSVPSIILSAPFTPPLVRGLTLHPDNPLQFDFIVDPGDDHLQGEAFQQESLKLIKYFLVALTVPEGDMWVNLSPYEKNRIIPEQFGKTEMGRDLLLQDYALKQLTASFMNPKDALGADFWKRVEKEVKNKYGFKDIPTDMFSKVWIIPDQADVYVKDKSVFVVNSHLKVMLEEDYLALNRNVISQADDTHTLTARIVKEMIVPAIEREVNEGKNFANLRQIQNSAILAAWYKKNLKETLLGKKYVDQTKTEGINNSDKETAEKIYNQYLEAFKKGAYEFVKDKYNPETQEIMTRKYVSGGITEVIDQTIMVLPGLSAGDVAILAKRTAQEVTVNLRSSYDLTGQPDPAMAASNKRKSAETITSSNPWRTWFIRYRKDLRNDDFLKYAVLLLFNPAKKVSERLRVIYPSSSRRLASLTRSLPEGLPNPQQLAEIFTELSILLGKEKTVHLQSLMAISLLELTIGYDEHRTEDRIFEIINALKQIKSSFSTDLLMFIAAIQIIHITKLGVYHGGKYIHSTQQFFDNQVLVQIVPELVKRRFTLSKADLHEVMYQASGYRPVTRGRLLDWMILQGLQRTLYPDQIEKNSGAVLFDPQKHEGATWTRLVKEVVDVLLPENRKTVYRWLDDLRKTDWTWRYAILHPFNDIQVWTAHFPPQTFDQLLGKDVPALKVSANVEDAWRMEADNIVKEIWHKRIAKKDGQADEAMTADFKIDDKVMTPHGTGVVKDILSDPRFGKKVVIQLDSGPNIGFMGPSIKDIQLVKEGVKIWDIKNLGPHLRYDNQRKLLLAGQPLPKIGEGGQSDIFEFQDYAVRVFQMKEIPKDYAHIEDTWRFLARKEIAPGWMGSGKTSNGFTFIIVKKIQAASADTLSRRLNGKEISQLLQLMNKLVQNKVHNSNFFPSSIVWSHEGQAYLVDAKDSTIQSDVSVASISFFYMTQLLNPDSTWGYRGVGKFLNI
jgi:hypothetical protein